MPIHKTTAKGKFMTFAAAALSLTLTHCATPQMQKIVVRPMPPDDTPKAYVFSKKQMDWHLLDGEMPRFICAGNVNKLLAITDVVSVGKELSEHKKAFPDSKVLAITRPSNVVVLRDGGGIESTDLRDRLAKIAKPGNAKALQACMTEYIKESGKDREQTSPNAPFHPDEPSREMPILPLGQPAYSAGLYLPGSGRG